MFFQFRMEQHRKSPHKHRKSKSLKKIEEFKRIARRLGIQGITSEDSVSEVLIKAMTKLDLMHYITETLEDQIRTLIVSKSKGNLIKRLATVIQDVSKEIVTVVVKAKPEEFEDNSVVKAAIAFSNLEQNQNEVGNALYFSRACIPTGISTIWHHIGIYSWQRDTLEKFVKLKPSPLEQSEKLEQLRALEAGIKIHSIVTDEHPIGVDTEQDLKKAENYFKDLV